MKKLSVATGNYTDKQTNEQKTEWTKLGVMGTSQAGKEYIMLDPKVNLAALPIGENGMIMVNVYDDSNQQNNQGGGYQAPQQQQSYQQPQQQQQSNNQAPQQQAHTIYKRQDGTFHDGNGTKLNQDGSRKQS